MRVGTQPGRGRARADDPTGVQDVFFRIGGPHVGKAAVSLEVNSDHVILDDIWAWRADHGDGVGWTVNTAATGLVVNGDDVTVTGLFVEHYQGYEVIWRGERGRTVMFQNEMPYDPPTQADWSHDGVPGFPAYKVADSVRTHEGWGLGSYIYTNVNPTLHSANAFEVPVTAGVHMHDLLTVSLNKAGTIDHVINGVGDPVTPDHQGPSVVVSYP
jgi:cytochrome c1